jgi:CRP-like cAMP-binding protein
MSSEDSQSKVLPGADPQLAKALPKLTPDMIAEVSPKLVRKRFAPGEMIIRQGEPADYFYVVLSGMAEIHHESLSGRDSPVDVCIPGEYFGEIGLLQNQPRTASVRAAETGVEVLALAREDFLELMQESRATETLVARKMTLRLIHLANFQS